MTTHHSSLGFRPSPGGGTLESGGIVIEGIGGSELLIGDVVFLNSSAKFVKTATPADYAFKLIGVVVGGDANSSQYDPSGSGAVACTADTKKVLIQVFGICKCIAGAVLATIGVPVSASAVTAGRIGAADYTHQILGTLLETSGAAGDAVKVFVNVSNFGEEDTV